MPETLDLASYFERIAYQGPIAPTLDTLRALHLLHPSAIAFESIDPLLGRPVAIDSAAVRARLVAGSRGGYCHEHNLLFHDVLAAIRFRAGALGARVAWMAQGRTNPRTHRLTLVDRPQGRFVADVGFGGQTPTAPPGGPRGACSGAGGLDGPGTSGAGRGAVGTPAGRAGAALAVMARNGVFA